MKILYRLRNIFNCVLFHLRHLTAELLYNDFGFPQLPPAQFLIRFARDLHQMHTSWGQRFVPSIGNMCRNPTFVQRVLALCEFHYGEFHITAIFQNFQWIFRFCNFMYSLLLRSLANEILCAIYFITAINLPNATFSQSQKSEKARTLCTWFDVLGSVLGGLICTFPFLIFLSIASWTSKFRNQFTIS